MLPYSNEEISVDSLPAYEQVTFTPVQKSYWRVLVIQFILTFLLAGGGLFLFTLASDVRPYRWIILGAYIVVMLIYLVLKKLAFKRRGFALRTHDILYQRGILANTVTIIAFSRIQHIALNEGMFSRMAHLAQLQIYTAGGSSSDLKISGLAKEDAEKIKDLIMRRMPQADSSIVNTDSQ